MANNEQAREDLMLEAVSLLRRIECDRGLASEPLTMGLNRLGWLFVYIGQDPMYRFDEWGRLRRAYVDGLLYRTEGHTLARIERHRTAKNDQTGTAPQSELLRSDLNADELESFRTRMRRELDDCLETLRHGMVTRQIPVDDPALRGDLENALRRAINPTEFLAPPIVRRKQDR